MKTNQVTMTPAMAAFMLSNATENFRRLNPVTVRLYAGDMRRGDWQETHQGIAVDSEGRLIDGQHRLHAVIDSGVTIKLNITHYDKETPAMIDRGRGRTVAQVITSREEKNSGAKAAIVAVALRRPVSASEVCEYVEHHRTVVESVISSRHGRQRTGLVVLGTLVDAVVHGAIALRDAISFSERYANSIDEHGTCPTAALRHYFNGKRNRHANMKASRKAVLAFAANKQMKSIGNIENAGDWK